MHNSITRAAARVAGVALAVALTGAAHAAIIYDKQIDPALYGNLDQDDVDACKDADGNSLSCGPTVAVNSFAYLQRQYPDIYGTRLIPDTNGNTEIDYAELTAVAELLATEAYMTCVACDGGTLIDDFILGKERYLRDVAPDTTKVKSHVWSPPGTPPPPWQFLFGELANDEDVEILIGFYRDPGTGGPLVRTGGHYLTVTGFSFSDDDMDSIIDGIEAATLFFIDPDTGMPDNDEVENVGDFMKLFYRGNDLVFIEAVVSESPVPEPATLLLFGVGLAGIWAGRRRRR